MSTSPRFTASLGPSARVDWGTPRAFFEPLNREFKFTVDAAATKENALLRRFWTPEQDGLAQSWRGERVWCNPPFGRTIGAWCAKAARLEARIAVLLIPSRTCTSWWHDFVLPYAELRFVRGRLKFVGADFSAPFPCTLAIYRRPA